MKIALQIVFVSVAFGLAGCASTQYLEAVRKLMSNKSIS